MSGENVRIRYQEVAPGLLQSRRRFTTASGQEVLVELDLNSKKYRILDSVTGTEVSAGSGTINNAVLKIKAKKSLSELGVSFADENRERNHAESLV